MPLNTNFSIAQLPPPHRELQLIVTIPAKNEAGFITSCLRALAGQKLYGRTKNCYEVIVLINHSSDGTLEQCRAFKSKNPGFRFHILVTYAAHIANVGAARKYMMDLAATRLARNQHLIAMTDADSMVGHNWVDTLLRAVAGPVALICGTIAVNCDCLTGFAHTMFTAKERYLLYRSQLEASILPEIDDPWPRHAANSGPNMAIKKEAYLSVGGMPAVASMEDAALHQRVVRAGLAVRHDPELQVTTSERLVARVAHGFGNELQFWSSLRDDTYIYAVEGLLKMQVRLRAFALVKLAYRDENLQFLQEISALLKLPLCAVKALFKAYPNYQAMNQRLFTVLEKHRPWQEAYPNISVLEANAQFALFFQNKENVIPHPSATAPVHNAVL